MTTPNAGKSQDREKKPDADKMPKETTPARNFIQDIIDEDRKTNKFDGRVQTRFPPEPNGYLHIGHAKSICLNFGLAAEYGGKCNLRFDDTNPVKEDIEYINSIMEDVRWLGFQWDGLYYASDYFEQLYQWAEQLIQAGKAYVCDLTGEEVARYRGDIKGGKESPYRNRSVEENLDLFRRMKAGEFPDGSRTLRAKIDMNSPNFNMRDPVMYRILHAEHPHVGNKWCIYPMYDWAHGQSDSIERITHSICTLEFENHRPLYDWCLESLGIYHPRQIEFARLNLTYTVLSKRRLIELVTSGYVKGWDDPRMPTIAGIRRRGYTPEAIRHVLQGNRRRQVQRRHRHGPAGELSARGSQSPRTARAGRAAASEGGYRQLSRRPDRGVRRGQQSRKMPAPALAKSPSRECCTSSRKISAKIRPKSSSAWLPAVRCGCATPTSSSASA